MRTKILCYQLNISANFEDTGNCMRISSIDTYTTLAKRYIVRCLNVGLVRSTAKFAECSKFQECKRKRDLMR